MKRVAVTGGIGSGKSTFCDLLAELSGAPVYDSDRRAKELMNSHPQIIADIVAIFGTEAYTAEGELNRAHIASALVKGGYVSSVPEAFASLLDEKCGIYTPPKRLSLADGIRFLRKIKAVPLLAHPLKEIDAKSLREMLPEMIEVGLVGMETMHSSYDEEKTYVSREIAAEFGLIESGGSDFHGRFKPGVYLGVGKGNLSIDERIFLNFLEAKSRM